MSTDTYSKQFFETTIQLILLDVHDRDYSSIENLLRMALRQPEAINEVLSIVSPNEMAIFDKLAGVQDLWPETLTD